MANYRVFEMNMLTNEWRDKGFHEGSGQQDVLRKSEAVVEGNTYFVVPETSYHPVTLAKVEVIRYAWQYGEPENALDGEPDDGES